MRVLLAEKSTSLFPQEIRLADQTFYLYNDAPSELVEIARSAILQGKTAAVWPDDLLKPQAIFFDMDATVIEEESLTSVAQLAGKADEVAALTERAMSGNMDFTTSLKMRLKLLTGLAISEVQRFAPTLCQGILQFSKLAGARDIPLFLVSGGFVEIAAPIAQKVGFKELRANRLALTADQKSLAGDVVGDVVDANGKARAVTDWCVQYAFNPKNCVAVGDGANDLLMMKLCGAAVGFRAKNILWPSLAFSNQAGDHRLLAALLGWPVT